MLRGGTEPLDIYRHIDAGINGTPMPSHHDMLQKEPDRIWHMVAYVLKIADSRRNGQMPESGMLDENGILKPLPGVRLAGRDQGGTRPDTRAGALRTNGGNNESPFTRHPLMKGSLPMDLKTKKQEMERLQAELQRLEDEINKEEAAQGWQPSSYYTAYYATAGFMLGSFGAMASLLFNVIGAPIAGKSPLELVRIYLTFPLGARRSS